MQYAPQYRLPFPSQIAYFCRTLVWNKAGPRRKQSLTASPSLATCDCAIARGALGRFAFASAGPATNQSRHHVLADVIRLGHVLAEEPSTRERCRSGLAVLHSFVPGPRPRPPRRELGRPEATSPVLGRVTEPGRRVCSNAVDRRGLAATRLSLLRRLFLRRGRVLLPLC